MRVEHTPADGREDVPEAQSLVTGPCDDALSTRADREVENALRVPRQRLDLLHARVLPENDLVQRVSVSADDLVSRL